MPEITMEAQFALGESTRTLLTGMKVADIEAVVGVSSPAYTGYPKIYGSFFSRVLIRGTGVDVDILLLERRLLDRQDVPVLTVRAPTLAPDPDEHFTDLLSPGRKPSLIGVLWLTEACAEQDGILHDVHSATFPCGLLLQFAASTVLLRVSSAPETIRVFYDDEELAAELPRYSRLEVL